MFHRRPASSLVLLAALALLPSSLPGARADEEKKPAFELEYADDPVVVIDTSKGKITVELLAQEAPKTVANFLGLATGTKAFEDPKTKEQVRRPFYDGLLFHRVIDDFMIQGGCPLGTGSGGPGYRLEDEINADALGLDEMKAVDMSNPQQPMPHPWIRNLSPAQFQQLVVRPIIDALGITSQEAFLAQKAEVERRVAAVTLKDVLVEMGYEYDATLKSRKPSRGTLAMANSGPNTNGSQFFISTKDNDYLSGRHTVFGKVVGGMDVVDAIGKVATDPQGNRPVEPVKILSIRRYEAQ